ncbi:hypothetical protein DL96DRAFT_1607600 [Flagelloscypha sp. PMI_526]|nr:hypothetical protein DL96DRAFT_1607600 [Flagelloscypha sp. PMI_526]
MFSLKTSLIALALSATSAVSVHIEALGRRHHQISNRSENELALERRQSGKFTYYDPEPVNIWNNGAHCGDTVTITINGKTTTAKVTDECMGCASNQLDLTPGLFQFFSGGPLLEVGEMYGSWDFGGSSGGGDSGNSGNNDNGDDDKAAKEAAAKKKADEDKAAAEKKAADEKAAAEKKAAAESSSSVASKSSASVASNASVASVSKASVAAVASASSVSAAAAKASAEAAAEAAQAEPTDAPQAVGGAVSGLDSSNGAPALRVSTPVVLFGALLGAAFVAL